MFRPRAILLDFYGTVVEEDSTLAEIICQEIAAVAEADTTPKQVAMYWNHLFNDLCDKSTGRYFRPEKELETDAIRQTLAHFYAPLDAQALSRRLFENWRTPKMLPGTREALSACNIPICLVSNVDNAELRAGMEYNRLSFDSVVTSEDCRAYKPHRSMFQKALEVMNLGPSEVLHVGDSLKRDVQGAKALGIPVMWINQGNKLLPPNQPRPDYTAPDLRGMLDILAGD